MGGLSSKPPAPPTPQPLGPRPPPSTATDTALHTHPPIGGKKKKI